MSLDWRAVSSRRRDKKLPTHVNAVCGRGEAVTTEPSRRTQLLIVSALTLLAATLHVIGQSHRPLWLDEAASYWTSQARAVDLLRGVGTDGTPPLYFLILRMTLAVFGDREFVLRVPSILAMTATVPLLYATVRRIATSRAALIAAALAALSPLGHYYAVEARNYALLQLETALILYSLVRLILAPNERRWWVLLAATETLQLGTHIYAIFLLPMTIVTCLLAGERGRRLALAGQATAASVVAMLLCLPWIGLSVAGAQAGVGDWIATLWRTTSPLSALIASIEAFGFGGSYPDYLSYLAKAPAWPVASLVVTLGLIAVALVPSRRAQARTTVGTLALSVCAFGPLLAAWLYSVFVRPLYLAGRYDTIVLPVFIALMAVGLDRTLQLRRWFGALVSAAIVALACFSWSTSLGPDVVADPLDVAAGQTIARVAKPDDRIVSTFLRQSVVAYYARRGGFRGAISSFPSEISEHPGWYSPMRLLQERTKLEADGKATAQSLVSAARAGHSVWILASQPSEIDDYLFREIVSEMDVDDARSVPQAGVVSLKLRANPEH